MINALFQKCQECWRYSFITCMCVHTVFLNWTLFMLCVSEGEGDILMDPLMVDWFNLIRKKQMYIRKESELVYKWVLPNRFWLQMNLLESVLEIFSDGILLFERSFRKGPKTLFAVLGCMWLGIRFTFLYVHDVLMHIFRARTQELEQQQPGVEGELRRLLEKPG